MNTKKCTKCFEEKTLDCFSKSSKSPGGLNYWCKDCYRKYNQSDHVKESRKRYYKSEIGKKKRLDATARNREKYPNKWATRQAVHHAIDMGYIKRPNECSICGISGVLIHAHHPDYSKRLDVVWCCEHCHKKLHLEMK